MSEWIGMLWVLVPLAAIIGGIVYAIARLRWGGGSGDGDSLQLLREAIGAQRDLGVQLGRIERRLDAIETVLKQVD